MRAFEHFGTVPYRPAYDNLRPAVRKILVGSKRDLASRFLGLANLYLIEPCFARPRTGHDKGGVEARGKGIRWQELVPIPSGPDLDTISVALLARLDARTAMERDVQGRTIAERFAEERALCCPCRRHRSARRRSITVA